MADTKPEIADTKPEIAPKTVEVFAMQAVHGPLNHPYTHVWFDAGYTVDHVNDEWTKGQIAADKLKIVPIK